jgi:hypothetical protein
MSHPLMVALLMQKGWAVKGGAKRKAKRPLTAHPFCIKFPHKGMGHRLCMVNWLIFFADFLQDGFS